ncbi:MAG: hypothetical protein RML73_01040 [Anaerolineae bacterium]|nr:hypothetical protein [Anaerolineae bacterium]
MLRLLLIISLLSLGLAACAPQSAPLPTLVPSLTPSSSNGQASVAMPTATPEVERALPPTFTPTDEPSATPTLTDTPLPTLSPTVTVTPSATITDTPTRTPTDEPTRERAISGLLEAALRATILPPGYVVPPFQGTNVFLPTPTPQGGMLIIAPGGTLVGPGVPPAPIAPTLVCTILPSGGFAALYAANPDIAAILGCAIGAPQTRQSAWQAFQNGFMLWVEGEIFALYGGAQTFQFYPDTYQPGIDPEGSTEIPPPGLLLPVRGFLKVWANNVPVRGGLGYATLGETGQLATVQRFGGGAMIHLSGRAEVLVLLGQSSGQWRSLFGQF